MKKAFSVFLLAVLLVITMIPALAAKTPTITVSSATAKPGDTVVLTVTMKNNPGINTFSFGFSYDTSKLSLIDVKPSSKLGGQFVYKKKAVWLNSKDSTYNGEILTLKFKIAKSARGNSKVEPTYSPGDISNYNEKDVSFTIEPGTISITSTSSPSASAEVKQTWFQKLIAFFKRIFSVFGKKEK